MAAWPAVGLSCVLAIAGVPQAQSPQSASTRASLVGTVRSPISSSQAPVPNIEVRIRLSGETDWKTSTTDEAGRYAFRDLVPGRYLVSLRAPGYHADLDDVMLRRGSETQVTLFKRSVLEGRVIDTDGQPVGGIEVCALRRSSSDKRVELIPAEYAITNSDGVFRMSRSPLRPAFTLGPGAFLLAVIPTGCLLAETGAPRRAIPLAGVVPTYYPNATSFREAAVVTVAGDELQTGFEIRLRRGPTTRLEGRVAPLPQHLLPPVARVILEPADLEVPITRVLNLGPDGRFVFDGLLPGVYRLIVPPTWRLNARSVWADQTVTVTGAPSQVVSLPTNPTMEVTGRVLFDGHPTLLPGVRVFFTVNLEAVRAERGIDPAMLPSPFGQVDSAGQFVIPNVMPGSYTFGVSGADARGWVLDAATIPAPPGSPSPDRDVFNLPFTVTNGLDITGATISLTRATATLDVTVRDTADQPVTDVFVVLFAADPKYWYPASRRTLSRRVGPRGTVTFENLPKGEYVTTAAVSLPPGWSTAKGLENLAGLGTRVRIEADETRAVTIRTTTKSVQ